MKILIVDNYDSFTYNLKHYFDLYCDKVEVVRNDYPELWTAIESSDKVVLSPGPGLPIETHNIFEIIEKVAGKKPLLGVCLGHQAIAQFYGEKLVNLSQVLHGKSTPMQCVANDALFTDLPSRFNVARDHSGSLNKTLQTNSILTVTGVDEHDYPLAFKHNKLNVRGVQFHPESILTEHGKTIIKNWVEQC